MGNTGCIGKNAGLDNLCAGRGFPEFIAPNTEHVTYSFNCARDPQIKLAYGQTGVTSDAGFALDPQMNERRAPKWYVLKEYAPNAAQLRVHVSGRVFVQCEAKAAISSSATSPTTVCAFKICTRGRPIYESIRTDNFTHTAHVVTSGVFFALGISSSVQGLFLSPRLTAVLENGDEVLLVDDRLGPLQPQSYYVDFAMLDDGGRNLQVDLIFRGFPGDSVSAAIGADEGSGGNMRTLRTCLQDYIAFNSQVSPASVSFSSSDLMSLLPEASVHLQNIVVSEERFEEQVPLAQPYDIWKEANLKTEKGLSGKLLYEGEDAYNATMASSVALDGFAAAHPQFQSALQHPPILDSTGGSARGLGRPTGSYKESLAESCTDDFWHHVRYDNDEHDLRFPGSPEKQLLGNPNCPDDSTHLRGEFWLSKHAVDKKNVYFHCSSTLAQATTMCIAFRFSCPLDYLQLIERASGTSGSSGHREAVSLLRDGHIPASGIVLGIEHDPRHRSLLRMFVEHRNEIKDDMVLCECQSPSDLTRSIAHQEVYDGGGTIIYRVTVLHRDGGRQSAVLQMNADDFEEANLDSARSYRLAEEPSPRFPISPCPLSQTLSPANRIFVYSAIVYENTDDQCTIPEGAEVLVDASSECCDERSMLDCSCHASDAAAEDWQSAGGGYSDCEVDDWQRARSARAGMEHFFSPTKWRRPLIESAVLLSRMEEPPFKCFPMSLT